MSGGTVPASGNNVFYTGTNSIRGVFGITNLLGARALTNLEPGPQPSSSGNVSMSVFRGQKVLQPPSAIKLTNCTSAGGTVSWTAPSMSALSNYAYYIGTTAGGTDVVASNNVTATSTTFTRALTAGSNYYVTVFTRNTSNGVSATGSSGALAFPGVGVPTIAFNSAYIGVCSFTATDGTAPNTYNTWFGSNTTYGSGTAILTLTGSSPRYFTSSVAMPSFYAIVRASNAVGVTTGTASALQTFVGTVNSFATASAPIDVISIPYYDGANGGYFVLSGSTILLFDVYASLVGTLYLPAVGKQIVWDSNQTKLYALSGVDNVSGYISSIAIPGGNVISVPTYTTFSGIASDGTNIYSVLNSNNTLYVLDPNTGTIGSAIYTFTGQTVFNITYNSSNSRLYIPTSNTSTGVYSTYSMTTAGGSVIIYPITQANRHVEFDTLFNSMLFTDGTSRIYKLAYPWTGTPEVLAGRATTGNAEGNALTTATFNQPRTCRMDTVGNGLLVCDYTNNKIRQIV